MVKSKMWLLWTKRSVAQQAIFIFCTFLLVSCALGPDYERPVVETPAAWRIKTTEEKIDQAPLWGDATFQTLLKEVIANNSDLKIAAERVLEAKAQSEIASAKLWPDLQVQIQRERLQGIDQPILSENRVAGLLSYEIDFFGKLRRASEAGRAEYLQQQEAQIALRLSLLAQLAKTYIELLALDERLSITTATWRAQAEELRIQTLRWQNGVASELEVSQTEAEATRAKALIPELEALIAQKEHALSALLGRFAGPVVRGEPLRALPFPDVHAGLPSTLITRRPDVREAEKVLIAANARVGEAIANRFPNFSLTTLLGAASFELSDFAHNANKIWQLQLKGLQTLFDGGEKGAEVDAARARQSQALLAYKKSIKTAFREVQDALVVREKTQQVLNNQGERVAALEKTHALAKLRYQEGLVSHIEVLDAERNLLNAKLVLVEVYATLWTAHIELYRALGGDWKNEHG